MAVPETCQRVYIDSTNLRTKGRLIIKCILCLCFPVEGGVCSVIYKITRSTPFIWTSLWKHGKNTDSWIKIVCSLLIVTLIDECYQYADMTLSCPAQGQNDVRMVHYQM